MTYSVIWMQGRPGVGKEVQSQLLVKIYNFFHTSTGDICRETAKDQNNPKSKKIIEWNNKGILFPNEFIIEMMREYITEKTRQGKFDPAKQKLIIDGYNRTPEQVKMIEKYFKTEATILLEVPIYVALLRMSKRQKIDPRLENATPRLRFNRQLIYEQNIEGVIDLLPKETLYKINSNRPVMDIHNDIVSILKT